ncbi:MAG: ISNCY family transposase [Thermodesulfovibrionales bacterium]
MAAEDIITMTQKELKRLHVIRKVMEGVLMQKEAAEMLSVSERQIRRIVRRIEAQGDKGIVHGARGKDSNRKAPESLVSRVVQLYREKYLGFGPTLMAEKLREGEGTEVSKESVRTWLMDAGLWQKGRKRKVHRQWRQRRACFGEMLQMDGSHHRWFEDRGPACVLMAYIDDATNTIYARFYEYEGTLPAMDSFKRYIRKYGIPLSVYLDKHTTYKSSAEPSIEDEINGTEPLSQFGRALTELQVKIIHANSPQAKGRIERLFKTLQDRLVKEMTVRGISSIDEANGFLDGYLALHNRKFRVQAKERSNLHRGVPKGVDLDRILCIRNSRTLRNDFTVAHNKKLYQVGKAVNAKVVTVEERVNGSMHMFHNNVRLPFREITERPEKQHNNPAPRRQGKPPVVPPDHPWRKANNYLWRQMKWNANAKKPAGATV